MTNYEGEPERNNRFVYWVAWALLVVFVVIALFTFRLRPGTPGRPADKADELIAALDEAGLTAPSKDQIVRVLGDDGGALCDDPGNALRKAITNTPARQRRGRAGHAADHRRRGPDRAGPADRDRGLLPRRARGLPGATSTTSKSDDVVNGVTDRDLAERDRRT